MACIPNRVCCNALMGAFARARPTQWKKAVDFVSYLWTQDESIQPDVITYNTALKACSTAFQLKQIEMLLGRHERQGRLAQTPPPSSSSSRPPPSRTARLFLQERHSAGSTTSPNLKDKCSSQLVVACLRCNMRDEAIDIFEDRLTASSHGVSEASEAIFSGLIMQKDCDAVIRLLDLMCEMRTLPSMNVCSSLIDFLCPQQPLGAGRQPTREHDLERLAVVSDRMLSVSTANSILRAMGRVIEEGVPVPRRPVPRAAAAPDHTPTSPVNPKDQADHAHRAARQEGVCGWFGDEASRAAPNQETFRHMVDPDLLGRRGSRRSAHDEPDAMTKQGCYPDQRDHEPRPPWPALSAGDTSNAIRLMAQLDHASGVDAHQRGHLSRVRGVPRQGRVAPRPGDLRQPRGAGRAARDHRLHVPERC